MHPFQAKDAFMGEEEYSSKDLDQGLFIKFSLQKYQQAFA